MNTSALVQKVWNFCNTLRDDGISYGDYLEQLTYLLFLKMAHEYTLKPHFRSTHVPVGFDWTSLTSLKNEELEAHYLSVLQVLSREQGVLGAIFWNAQNKIQDSAKLARLVQLIDAETWIDLNADTKGDLYEGLLQKNAEDTKSGAGQYFTPRPLIQAIVDCVQPEPLKTIADPACGTGGFFLGAYNWFTRPGASLSTEEESFLRKETFFGNEIVANTRRMCLMNLFLHGIGELHEVPSIDRSDALISPPKKKVDYVLANPPFGKKSSITITNLDDEDEKSLTYERADFWETTSNKQLNFLQHIVTMLKENGKAAVVLPDNVLFEGGVGERIRRQLLENCDVHTILRLPSGIFYAHGVKANVVFFDAKPKSERPNTKGIWFYDLRTNKHFTLKARALKIDDLRDFINCYKPGKQHERQENERFRYFAYEELVLRERVNLDVFWLKDDGLENLDNLPPPEVLQAEIIDHIEAALVSFRDVAAGLQR